MFLLFLPSLVICSHCCLIHIFLFLYIHCIAVFRYYIGLMVLFVFIFLTRLNLLVSLDWMFVWADLTLLIWTFCLIGRLCLSCKHKALHLHCLPSAVQLDFCPQQPMSLLLWWEWCAGWDAWVMLWALWGGSFGCWIYLKSQLSGVPDWVHSSHLAQQGHSPLLMQQNQ